MRERYEVMRKKRSFVSIFSEMVVNPSMSEKRIERFFFSPQRDASIRFVSMFFTTSGLRYREKDERMRRFSRSTTKNL